MLLAGQANQQNQQYHQQQQQQQQQHNINVTHQDSPNQCWRNEPKPSVYCDNNNNNKQLSGDNFKQLIIYISSIVVIALTILNASLSFWILVSLNARNNLQTDSFIGLTPAGINLHGQSMFNRDLVVSEIKSKNFRGTTNISAGKNLPTIKDTVVMQFNTDTNLTFSVAGKRDILPSVPSNQPQPQPETQPEQQISFGANGVINLGDSSGQLVILSPRSSPKVIINSSSVLIEASKLTTTNRAGLDARGLSIQTKRLCGEESLSLHSPTQKLSILAPKGLQFQSTNGSVSIEASERVSIRSSGASVILASPLIDATNIKTIIPSQTGRTYMNIYKLCYCHLASTNNSNASRSLDNEAIRRHRRSSRKGSLAEFPNIEAPPSTSKSQQTTRSDHSRLGLLFGVKPSLNCSSFNWFCNIT